MANKLSFCLCVLLVTLTVNSFWSSNIQVMALRELPLKDVQVIEQVVQLRKLSCYSICYSNAECAKPCTLCRQAKPHYSRELRCSKPK
ncbi:hypothetical protein K7X08_014001 [Anisodus acutangulus]|uniref:Uncharacterized protein n=1 Tax=Anisodus acutangulus TaxID=402998 RepID=A0A9Q1LPU7_9SOLA|nr:hypothetical protein K7X08_014001 [Anisodus acutangulus]